MRRLAIFLVLTATVASVPAVAAGSPSAPELPDPVPVRRMLGARARDELAGATAGPDDGSAAVCYIGAGSWERWRPDAGRFPDRVLSRSTGLAGGAMARHRSHGDPAPHHGTAARYVRAQGLRRVRVSTTSRVEASVIGGVRVHHLTPSDLRDSVRLAPPSASGVRLWRGRECTSPVSSGGYSTRSTHPERHSGGSKGGAKYIVERQTFPSRISTVDTICVMSPLA